jgi:predicted heme/steroid binding protein
MRFFRDLSRHKARRRLDKKGADTALVAMATLVLGREEPLRVLAGGSEDTGDTEGTDFTMGARDLAGMDGRDGRPLYLAIRGRIYDVTSGRSFYGAGRSYHHFVGRDASRAFATGCSQPACLVPHLDGLSSDDLREVDRWVELYEFHDKYSYVGRLVSEDPVGDAVDAALREEEALRAVEKEVEQDTFSSQGRIPKVTPSMLVDALVKKGKERYAAGSMSEATMFWSAALTRMGGLTEGGVGGEGGGEMEEEEEEEEEEVAVDAEENEENERQRSMDLNYWAEGMLRRADILSFLAAALQKQASNKSLEEALARYLEAVATVMPVITFIKSHHNPETSEPSLEPCIMAKAWTLQARIEGDLAALHVMRSAVLYRVYGGKGRDEGGVDLLGMHEKALASFASAKVFVEACTEAVDEADPNRFVPIKRLAMLQSNVDTNYRETQVPEDDARVNDTPSTRSAFIANAVIPLLRMQEGRHSSSSGTQ